MNVINKSILTLTNDEKALLNKAAALLIAIERKDPSGDLANPIFSRRDIYCFGDLAAIIYDTVASIEEEEEE